MCQVETLAERVKVKFTEGTDTFYKKYQANEIKIIKDAEEETEKINEEELKELEEMEKLDKEETSTDEIE